jgi:hypothetical protein
MRVIHEFFNGLHNCFFFRKSSHLSMMNKISRDYRLISLAVLWAFLGTISDSSIYLPKYI